MPRACRAAGCAKHADTGPGAAKCSGPAWRGAARAGRNKKTARCGRLVHWRQDAALQAASPVPSTCCSSPDSYISIMMSEPPMNSPFT